MNSNFSLEDIQNAAEKGAENALHRNSKLFKSKGFKIKLSLGCIAFLFIVFALVFQSYKSNQEIKKLGEQLNAITPVENHDLTLDNNGFFGFTVVDFQEAVLGKSLEQKKLIVYERELSEISQITKSGFANIELTTKSQLITYTGLASYSVDLSKLNNDSIVLDEETKTVIIKVPRPILESINIDEKDIIIGDIEKGLLAFGNIKYTADELLKIQAEARQKMRDKLVENQEIENAKSFAKMMIWEIYQPIISNVSPEYKLSVEFFN